MTENAPGQKQDFRIQIADSLKEGHYADFASIWHNRETFVLDFVATSMPPRPGEADDGSQTVVVDGQVVTRVRIPASQVWEVMKALERQYTIWERETGHR